MNWPKEKPIRNIPSIEKYTGTADDNEANRFETEYEAKLEAEAEAALDRITRGQSWDDWLKIGELFCHGRKQAMLHAHTNEPAGKGYNLWFGGWMDRHPKLKAIDKATRNHAMQCFDNADAIKEWRTRLADNQRQTINHPTTVLRRWKREQPGEGEAKARKQSAKDELHEKLALFEAENAKLRKQIEKDGENVFSMADTAENIGRLLAEPTNCSLDKATRIHKALGEALTKRRKFEAEKKRAGPR